jgi:SSS family solute:Na+ symporter
MQFLLIVLGFLPLVLLGLTDVGGWAGLTAKLETVATNAGFSAGAWSDSWRHMDAASANPMGVEWFGMVMGLGFVLSFGYWCTDFLVVQRAMAADSMTAARRTPLLAAFPKMLFPFLVVLSGMIVIALQGAGTGLLPIGSDAGDQREPVVGTGAACVRPRDARLRAPGREESRTRVVSRGRTVLAHG